jgi:hypothetical protein
MSEAKILPWNLPRPATPATSVPDTPPAAVPVKSETSAKMNGGERAAVLTQAAQKYHDNHHWVPLRLEGKSPDVMGKGWQKRTVGDPLPKFKQGDNIGILLGKPSGDIVRLDPDFSAIPAVTEILFPEPTLLSGRKSSPRSGRLYICNGLKSRDFQLPSKGLKDDPRLPLHNGKPGLTVVQLLSTGKQHMAPPSLHPESGEEIVWENDIPLATLDANEMLRRVGIEAFLLTVRHFWPARGKRNEAAWSLARVLLEALATRYANDEERIAVVDALVLAVAMAGGDGEASRDGKERAAATLAKMKAGEDTTGLPRLLELLELPTSVTKTFRGWLGLAPTRGQGAAIDPNVAKLNESYALVIVGDKTAIMNLAVDGAIKFLTHSAFDLWHANRYIYYQDKNGDQKKISLAKHWLHHPQRRQYEGIVFAPGREVPNHFNLWRGFAVEPKTGDCSKFLAHMKDNVCRGDDKLYKWVVGWFAQIFQQPENKMGTSLVLRGPQGVGKTKVGEVTGSLLGVHYVPVSDPRFVTGRFNSHLISCLLLHADEGFWAGDHAAEGKLKDLITGKHHFIEYKGKEPIRVANYVRLLVSGNPDWLVPAGFEERRFATLDVGDAKMKNTAYFAAIDAEMDNGGREALLNYLLSFDLKAEGVNLREIPKTAALLDQKLSSLSPEQGWWLDTLMRGELPWGVEEPGRCPASRLFERYIKHASRRGARRRSIEVQLGMFLRKHVPKLIKSEATYKHWTGSEMKDTAGAVYAFPPLAECRAAFAKTLGHDDKIAWVEKSEWSFEPVPDPEPREVPF